jgi:endonuclease/exonuclease/phosphatase family metal-dependent hydrolase
MGWAQIRIVNYNVLEQVRPGMTEIFTAIGGSARGGFAQPPDIVLLQESRGASTTAEEFKTMLNEIYGVGVYGRGILTGSSTGSGGPSVVYRTNKVTLVAEVQVNNTSTSGAARSTLRYQFRPVGYDSAADFYVYNSHFKASSDSTSRNRRGIEAGEIRANADALGEGVRAIYSGDFNLYSSSEPGFQNFVAAGVGQAFDPVDRVGSWSNAGSFRDVHTQSPVTVARFGNQVTGGMDDRFDFQLVTGPLMSGRGFAYIPGSYWAFGNTGTHQMDREITSGSVTALQSYLSGYTEEQAAAVLTAVTESSDHLPVVADYQLPARMAVTLSPLPARILRGATVSLSASVSNSAEVTVPAGADRLDFSWSGSGELKGSGSGTVQPLGPAQGASPVWDTSAAGAKTGTLTITAESPQAFPASFSTNLTTMVLEPAGASFDGGTTTNALTVDLGTVAMGAAAPSAMFRVYNRASSSGPALTADLDVDGVNAPAGGASPMSVTLATGRVTAGGSVQGTVNLATATPGTYERVFTVQISDENVPGEGSQTLVLTVQGTVTAAQSALEPRATG